MQDYQHLAVVRDGTIVTVRLQRESQRNALDAMLMRELTEVARELRSAPDVQAVILRGSDSYFSAGADLSAAENQPAARAAQTLLEARVAARAGPDMCQAWEDIEAVTIAAIEGFCIGGGCALVMACDFRVGGEGAAMRLPEVPLGINMSWHAVPRLTALIGPSRAKRFILFGDTADTALLQEWGLLDECVAEGSAYEEAYSWARRLAALPPLPLRMTKQSVNAAAGALQQATSFMDRDQFLLTAMSDDFREGVAAFFERRDPRFKGN